jgi:hypothetical protein
MPLMSSEPLRARPWWRGGDRTPLTCDPVAAAAAAAACAAATACAAAICADKAPPPAVPVVEVAAAAFASSMGTTPAMSIDVRLFLPGGFPSGVVGLVCCKCAGLLVA